MSYETANWAKLSPAFRAAHNRLRRVRGLPSIPEPKIDLYVPQRAAPRPLDMSDKEFIAAARQFLGPTYRLPGSEGYKVPDKWR